MLQAYLRSADRPLDHIHKLMLLAPNKISCDPSEGVCAVCAGIHSLGYTVAGILVCKPCTMHITYRNNYLHDSKHDAEFKMLLTKAQPIIALERMKCRYVMSIINVLSRGQSADTDMVFRCHICYADTSTQCRRYTIERHSLCIHQCDICSARINDYARDLYTKLLVLRELMIRDCYVSLARVVIDDLSNTLTRLDSAD